MTTPPPPLLILTDWFPPAFEGGGPIRSCYKIAHLLSKNLPVYVLTSDTDHGQRHPLEGVNSEAWMEYEPRLWVRYLPRRQRTWGSVIQHIRELKPETIYLNSLFSPIFTLYPLLAVRLGLIRSRVVLAPRGMLKPSSLRFKAAKKTLFLNVFRVLGLPGRIHFHATAIEEAHDIREAFGPSTAVEVIPALPETHLLERRKKGVKKAGELRLCYLGRIHPHPTTNANADAFTK